MFYYVVWAKFIVDGGPWEIWRNPLSCSVCSHCKDTPHVKKVTFIETSLYFSWKNQRGFLLGVLYKFCSNIFPDTLYSGFLIIITEYKGNIIDLYHPSLDFPTGHQLNNIIYNLSHDMNHWSVLAPFYHCVNRLSRWVIWFLIYCGESWCGIKSI